MAAPPASSWRRLFRSLGGEVALVEAAEHVLAREPAPLGEALGEALRRDGIELALGVRATAARRDGEDYVLELDDGRELRGDRLLVATGRRPRVEGFGLETVGVEANGNGIPVDAHLRAGERCGRSATSAASGPDPRGRVPGRGRRGEHPRRVASGQLRGRAARRLHRPPGRGGRRAQARFSATAPVSGVSKTATYTHAYAESNGFLTLLSDGERLTGAYALGPEAGEWLQQATLAIRARVPLEVLRDTIQPFPTFSEIYNAALKALQRRDHRRARAGRGGIVVSGGARWRSDGQAQDGKAAVTAASQTGILPRFTSMDIEHKGVAGVSLDDYGYMSQLPTRAVSTRRSQRVGHAAAESGEPRWSQDQLQLYKEWIDGGYQP